MNHFLNAQLQRLRSDQLDWATPNYCFRSFVKADVHPLYLAAQNPGFNKFLLWNKPDSIEAAMVQVKKLLREESLNQSVTFSIVTKERGAWAGFLRWIPHQDGLAISFWLHPDFWGTGASRELVDSVFGIVFETTDIIKLFAFIQPANLPTIRLAKNKNMTMAMVLDLMHEDGEYRQFEVYETDRAQWTNAVAMQTF